MGDPVINADVTWRAAQQSITFEEFPLSVVCLITLFIPCPHACAYTQAEQSTADSGNKNTPLTILLYQSTNIK